MKIEQVLYLAFVDVPKPTGGYKRYYLKEHAPSSITEYSSVAKRYKHKGAAEKSAKWLCENIRPDWSDGLDYQSKNKRCGIEFRKIFEIIEETIL